MANIENVNHLTVNVSEAVTTVFGEDTVSNFMLLQNVSDADMYLQFGSDAVVGSGILLKAGGDFLLDCVSIDAGLTAVHGNAGDKTLLVTVA